MPRKLWNHVPTGENPADCASRGITVEELIAHPIYWTGPWFLREKEIVMPVQPTDLNPDHDMEERQIKPLATSLTIEKVSEEPIRIGPIDLERFSSIRRATSVLSHMIRFCRMGMNEDPIGGYPDYITVKERAYSLSVIVKAYQKHEFGKDMSSILKAEQVSTNSRLKSLYPFVDTDGILKVGGRLQQSQTIPDEMKYPAILPKNCRLAALLARQIHEDTMHGCLQLCIAELRRNYWVISSRSMFRKIIRDCVKCCTFNSRALSPLMGDLPEVRITPSPAFTHTGLDFAGPFYTKCGTKVLKSYLAVFVCFTTKAIHLELVSSMTAGHCHLALRRFSSRRGAPLVLYSDNGTNFCGTRTELVKLRAQLETKFGSFPKLAAELGTAWKMIPPGSPHFGGLWEAAVKSAKRHLKKIMGKCILTWEEMYTLTCDIEAILNSRPLVPASSDVKDTEALTPNMLLTGKSMRFIPLAEPKPLKTAEKLAEFPLERWAYIQNLASHFWKRWSAEYLTTLQAREKWTRELPNLEAGDVVLVSDERRPPLEWPLARITQAWPGNDGVVRTAEVKTAKGIYSRPTHKLRKLPVYPDHSDPHDTSSDKEDDT
jgi:transposase InsO family protein